MWRTYIAWGPKTILPDVLVELLHATGKKTNSETYAGIYNA
jgi:hypothetical protein